jgi:putative flippase GtrA
MLNLLKTNEFLIYFIIGGLATLLDWSTFWLLSTPLNVHYQFSLIGAYLTAGIFHYTANKYFTFGCQSKKIGSQLSLYSLVTLTSLACSLGIMGLLVSYLSFNKMVARMLTTILVLVPNYLLHKHITFNKKLFLQSESRVSPPA